MAANPSLEAGAKRITDALEVVRQSAGRIHHRERYVIYETDLTEAFIDDDGVLRTTLVVDPSEDEFEDEARFRYWDLMEWRLFHYLQFNDLEDSTTSFRKELQAIRDHFRGNASVFGIPERPETHRTLRLASKDTVELGDSLVHEGILTLTMESSEVKT